MIWTRSPRERVTSACWGMGSTLLGRRAGCCTAAGPANARTHHLHVVQASTLPTPNQVLLRDNGDDYTRAKTELIQELTDKARAERGLPPTGWGRSEQCGKSERC
jgi:hypothetical protein